MSDRNRDVGVDPAPTRGSDFHTQTITVFGGGPTHAALGLVPLGQPLQESDFSPRRAYAQIRNASPPDFEPIETGAIILKTLLPAGSISHKGDCFISFSACPEKLVPILDRQAQLAVFQAQLLEGLCFARDGVFNLKDRAPRRAERN